jgi:Ca-activated chloride channel family protein
VSELTFDDLRYLHLLWAALGACAVAVYGTWQRRRALRAFAAPRLLGHLAPQFTWARVLTRLALVVLSLIALVGAIIGPRWGTQKQQVTRRNIDVMVLLDVSRSMLARDIAPNRLQRARISIRDDLLPALGGDRVGLITFAGIPTLKCPLTEDYGFYRLALEDVGTESSPRGGTLIGDAIRKAGECFSGPLDTHKIVILVTDGEDHESFPVEAAQGIWEDHQIPIVAVALGDEREGARIPLSTGTGETYLEYKGEVVWSKANFDDLRRIAEVSDLNAFVPVGTRNFDLGEIYRQKIVPAVDAKERAESEVVPLPARAHVFATAALALLLIESFMRDGPRRKGAAPAAANNRREAA